MYELVVPRVDVVREDCLVSAGERFWYECIGTSIEMSSVPVGFWGVLTLHVYECCYWKEWRARFGTAREVRRAMGMAMGFCPAIWLPPCTGARADHIELMLRDVGRGSLRATGPFKHRTLLVPDLGAAPLAASRRV